MDQAVLTTLLAQAGAEIVKTYLSFVDFDSERKAARVFMEEVMADIGLTAAETHETADRGTLDLKQKIHDWAERKARVEIAAAIHEAEDEQATQSSRLAVLRKSREETEQMIARSYRPAPEGTSDDFIQLFNSSRDAFLQAAERSSKDMTRAIQMKHRLNLEHCFRGHLVSEETAKKLAELYEVK